MSQGFWSQLLNMLSRWDNWLFFKINTQWTNAFLDYNMPWYRDQNTWIPLYFFLLLFVLINFGKKIWPWIIIVVLTVVITDQTGNLLKDLFNRTRPCNDALLMQHMRLLMSRCPSSGSFISNHSANHFGIAVLIFSTLKPALKKWRYLFLIWAATICYAQVYVGVHYPFDVVGGAAAGIVIGLIMATIYNRFFGLPKVLLIEKNNIVL